MTSIWNTSFRRLCMVVPVAALCAVSTGRACAEITRVEVHDSGSMGTFGGREYTWVSAHMEGAVARDDGTTGRYRVPITLNYPDRDANGIGLVDIVNTGAFTNFFDETAPLGRRDTGYRADGILSDFPRREGFTYLSVQWSRMATEQLGPDYGVIENGLDGWEIVKDAARLLRAPQSVGGDLPSGLPSVERVIGFGYSQTGRLLRQLVAGGQNREADGRLVFDGILAGGATTCLVMNNDEAPRENDPGEPTYPTYNAQAPCALPFPEDGKFIYIMTQTEIERALVDADRPIVRQETPSYRQYELAGVAHIPAVAGRPLRSLGARRQNPVGFQPVYKAMLRHLVAWIDDGKELPPPLYIEGSLGADGKVHMALDADGNALGGVRLPHMASTLPNGEPAGAPLGVYGGVDLELRQPGMGFASQGGTFEPFPPGEIARRYPTREAYVDLVRKAADALYADAYILEEDRDAYVREAERRPLTPVIIDPLAIVERV